MTVSLRSNVLGLILVAVLGLNMVACSESPNSPTTVEVDLRSAKGGALPTVTSTSPNASSRDTTIDVRIIGSGFDAGSRADFLLAGTVDTNVRTNSTRYVSATELVANITIAAAAVPAYRDVAVITAAGKKGIGTESFVVLQGGVMSISGVTNPEAWDVNSSGLAVGEGTGSGSCATGFTWSQVSGGAVLPSPTGFSCVTGRLVNDAGVVAGNVGVPADISATRLARWIPTGTNTWNVEVLPAPGSNLVWLTEHDINGDGSVLTTWKNPNGTWDSWFWRSTTGWQMLAKPSGATWCSAEALNNAEQITGYCNGTGGGAVYWATPASVGVRLPATAGAISNKASAINNLGVIAGSNVVGGQARAARWRPNGSGGWLVDDLGALGNATGLNDDGMIVGLNSGAAFYIPPGSPPLSLGPISSPSTVSHVAVGNRGADGITWIVGWGPASPSGGYRAIWWKK